MSSSRSLIRFFGPALLFAPSGSRAIASSHCSVSYGPSSLLKAKISFSPRPPERSIPPSKMHFILRIKYILLCYMDLQSPEHVVQCRFIRFSQFSSFRFNSFLIFPGRFDSIQFSRFGQVKSIQFNLVQVSRAPEP